MRDRKIKPAHRRKLREFFRFAHDISRGQDYGPVASRLSPALRRETALLVAESTLCRVWYLSAAGMPATFLGQVALGLETMLYGKREQVPLEHLTVRSMRAGHMPRRHRIRARAPQRHCLSSTLSLII